MKEITEKIPSLAECLLAAEDTKYLAVGKDALPGIPQILNTYYCGNDTGKCITAVFADKNTFGAAGNTVEEILGASGNNVVCSFIFDEGLHADYSHVETLKVKLTDALEKAGDKNAILVPIAVGSGTINDLVKRAADELALPYLCVPTAASVDGYTAYGAALLYEGFKQTMPCKAPLAVIADSSVLAAAPAYLSSSGYGDLAGKIIAGTDWIIADRIFQLDGKGGLAPGVAAIENTAWAMVQNPLKNNLIASADAIKGDTDAVKTLFEALGITGFALQYMKDSRAVSGCEHMWSHVWEMENLCVDGVPVTHGHKVVMGTLAAAAFTECLFAEKPEPVKNIPSWSERELSVHNAFADLEQILPSVLETVKSKFIDDAGKLIKLREGILDNWESMKEAIFAKLPPYAELRIMLGKAGCPVIPEAINLTREHILDSAIKAQMIRKRFTVLDLAFELGVFDTVLNRMESAEYFV